MFRHTGPAHLRCYCQILTNVPTAHSAWKVCDFLPGMRTTGEYYSLRSKFCWHIHLWPHDDPSRDVSCGSSCSFSEPGLHLRFTGLDGQEMSLSQKLSFLLSFEEYESSDAACVSVSDIASRSSPTSIPTRSESFEADVDWLVVVCVGALRFCSSVLREASSSRFVFLHLARLFLNQTYKETRRLCCILSHISYFSLTT